MTFLNSSQTILLFIKELTMRSASPVERNWILDINCTLGQRSSSWSEYKQKWDVQITAYKWVVIDVYCILMISNGKYTCIRTACLGFLVCACRILVYCSLYTKFWLSTVMNVHRMVLVVFSSYSKCVSLGNKKENQRYPVAWIYDCHVFSSSLAAGYKPFLISY